VCEREKGVCVRERDRESECERERECVCVRERGGVCVCERESARGCVCEREREREEHARLIDHCCVHLERRISHLPRTDPAVFSKNHTGVPRL